MNKNKFYVTTPIYYVNAKPHLGTLYSTLLADVAARWNKLMGKKVYFLTGTDEHGQKIQERAQELGKKPQEFVDSMIPDFKRVWERYGIEYDKFIRTTDVDHKKAVHYWIKKLQEQDDIYKSQYTGWYCVPCETFVTVESEGSKDKNGNYLCPTCERKLQEVAEESYFFRLSAYEEQLLEFYEKNPNFITPKERMNEVISFVKSGLRDLSISRKTVSWGIPFPGDKDHTVYVWGDALNNYISAIGYGQDSQKAHENFEFWWPANMHIMAKDIVRFHAVYWPAFLMAQGIELPKQLLVHGYILIDDKKMSKSRGNAIDPDQLADHYGVEPVRHYLLRHMAINQDGHFDLKSLEEQVNADLANNLGNLLNRTIALALKNDLKLVKPSDDWHADARVLHEECLETFRFYWEEMNKSYYHVALSELFKFISKVNAYFHKQEPWILAKKDPKLFAEVISACCHSLRAIGTMLWPIMPTKMTKLLKAIGVTFKLDSDHEGMLRGNNWDTTFTLGQPEGPLFARPEEWFKKLAEEAEMKEIADGNVIGIEDFAKVELHVGTIEQCEPVKESSKLLRMQVNLGPLGMRQILSGIAKAFTPAELIGKQGIFVTNLKPRKMIGYDSQGMMLLANDSNGLTMSTVAGPVENGTRLM